MTRLDVDFCVVGGGISGICAAIAAARAGRQVALVHNRAVLGGNASSEIRMHIVGADCHGERPGTRESGLMEELRLEEAFHNPQRSYSMWDLILYHMVLSEPGITLLLDTECLGCRMEGDRIASVRALRNSTEDQFEIAAPYYADCTGDGRLGMEAGADFRVGREGRAEFGEAYAPEQADGFTLGSSLLMTARRHDTPQPFRAPPGVRRFAKDDFRGRYIGSYEYGFWWAEWGGKLDTIRDNAAIRDELCRIVLGVWDYIKNSGDHPGSAHWALDWFGMVPGKRESRRFLGPVILTEGDLLGGRLFPDTVAYGGWPLDLHPPGGIDDLDQPACQQIELPHLYAIPLRALVSRNVQNLFLAGRNISATHVAFASTRVMATCAAMGQAIGTAAAVGIAGGAPPASRLAEPPWIGTIQQQLLRDDAFLPGVPHADSGDLARTARVHASSQAGPHLPASVLDGTGRELKAAFGPWAEEGGHRWESADLPAWIELEFPAAVEIAEVHLTFDTGFDRELTLTASDKLSGRMVRGAQPETVRDYRLLINGVPVLEEAGNYQRKRVHRLAVPIRGQRLRLSVDATNGSLTARVFEIRAYSQHSD